MAEPWATDLSSHKTALTEGFEIEDGGKFAHEEARKLSKAPTVLSMLAGEERAQLITQEWRITLYLGPTLGGLVFLGIWLASPEGMTSEAQRLAGVAVWMAIWWMTEALPLGVGSMLPLAVFPMFGIATNKEVAGAYSSTLFWLFFGGIQLSLAIERSGLHRRIALAIIRAMGTRVAFLQLGLNLAVGLLSMFLSNTSTTVMLLPVATALIAALEAGGSLGVDLKKPFMLGLCYSASTGGIGTIIGTAPNGVIVAVASDFGIDIGFAKWMAFGAPFSVLMILFLWCFFVIVFRVPFKALPSDHPLFEQLQRGPGPRSQAETRVGIVFACTVFAWMTRSLVEEAFCLPSGFWKDDTIALVMVISLFIVKAEYRTGEVKPLMEWETLLRTPWDLFFLFGGGLALAEGFKTTGLSLWLGEQLVTYIDGTPIWFTIGLVCLCVTFLTEITSNVATASVWLPIVAQISINMGKSPLFLMIPTTLASSCAFMLPVATPPNAIVFGSGMVTIRDMAKTGFFLSLCGVVFVTSWVLFWGPVIFDFDEIPPLNARQLADGPGAPANCTPWIGG